MSDKKNAVFKVHIQGSIEDVWHEITKTDEVQGAMRGGKFIASTLKSIVETGRPSWTTRLLFKVFALMEGMSPKKSLSSNWQL